MSARFTKLTRSQLRKIEPDQRVTEHGITAERLLNGDIRYSVNVMVDGQRIHRVIGRDSEGVTITQAEEFISRARNEAREQRLTLPRGRKLYLTFKATGDQYLVKLKEIGGRDYVNNEQHLRLHLIPYFGAMRYDQISSFTVAKFRSHCRKKGLGDPTINRILATFRRMGRRLVKWKVVPQSLPPVELARENNRRTFVISGDEEFRLLEAAKNDADPYIRLFIKIGLGTALRHSEILSARFENFDPAKKRLRVRVKGGKWRYQPLPPSIAHLLKKEREMSQDQDGWIFPSRRSASGHAEQMSLSFARCVMAAGMDPKTVTPHTMRHTAITRLSATGADIKTIQEFSGHESVSMVLRYAHAQDHVIDRVLERMEQGTVVEHPATAKAEKS